MFGLTNCQIQELPGGRAREEGAETGRGRVDLLGLQRPTKEELCGCNRQCTHSREQRLGLVCLGLFVPC